MAKCVFRVINEFELIDMVHALVFDTTASNKGRRKGCVTLFEAMLDHPVLWLACRHHLPELFIKQSIAIRGESKELKSIFVFIDLEQRTLWT